MNARNEPAASASAATASMAARAIMQEDALWRG
jgi:hypothetical protein